MVILTMVFFGHVYYRLTLGIFIYETQKGTENHGDLGLS